MNEGDGEKVQLENCRFRFSFQCPKSWAELKKTSDEAVRHCHQCNQPVYFVENRAQLAEKVEAGLCVAFIPSASIGEVQSGAPAESQRSDDQEEVYESPVIPDSVLGMIVDESLFSSDPDGPPESPPKSTE